MKKYKSIFNISAVIIILFLLFYPEKMIVSAKNGLLSWFNNVVPSLFPFMVMVNIITNNSNLKIPKFIFYSFENIFNVNGHGILAYIFGLLSGYPLGAKISADIYFKNDINSLDVQKLLSFCCNAGPMFIVGTLACQTLNCAKAGYIILISSIISNTFTGIILNRTILNQKNYIYGIYQCSAPKNNSSVQNSCEAVIRVGGYIILFSVISDILEIFGVMSILSKIMSFIIPLGYNELKSILTGSLEMTCGINVLKNSTADLSVKAAIGGFIVSFGGISVIAQSIDFLNGTNINISLFALSKFINGVFTAFITYYFVLFII